MASDTYHGYFGVQPVHPFPARMAPSIAFNHLRCPAKERLTVLDPMAGSGTTLIAARRKGHAAIGFDTDPLAELLTRVSVMDVNPVCLLARANEVHEEAVRLLPSISQGEAYPTDADAETKEFVRYWFDVASRRQLTALSRAIDRVGTRQKPLLWCGFSRLIIAKDSGASLARDLSHSRPHKSFDRSRIQPIDEFVGEIKFIAKNSVFSDPDVRAPKASIQNADARRLPLDSQSVDLVITSPPYLNAIDYIRCSKFTLVWLGHAISELRRLRSTNVGAEISQGESAQTKLVKHICAELDPDEQLTTRHRAIVARYVHDMGSVVNEISRTLKRGGKAVIVIGNSTVGGHFVKNSVAMRRLFEVAGMDHMRSWCRQLPPNRRYLPPPRRATNKNTMHTRMREEVVMTFRKAA
jgi:hypothetical protein